MTLVEAESPSSDAGSGEWQDHWPHISYDRNYDHQNQKQVDPETVLALLQSVGLTEEDIDGLHVSFRNPMKRGVLLSRHILCGYFIDESKETKGPAIYLSYTPDTQELGKFIVHEATHYYDSLKNEEYQGGVSGKRLAQALGVGVAAVSFGVSHQLGAFTETDELGKYILAAQFSFFYTIPTVFKDIAYAASGKERRAMQAEKNNPLVQEEIPGLFVD